MVFWVTSSTHGVHPPLHSTRLLKCTSPKQEPEYISLGSGGLGEPEVGRYLGSFLGPSGFVSSPLPPAAHENTLPRAAGMSAPTMDTSRNFLSPFVIALKVAELQSLPKFSSSSLLFLRQLLFVPFHLSAMPVHLHESSQAHMSCSYCYFALFSFTPNQRTALSVLCSRRIYSYAAQNQTDASAQDMPENTIFQLCFNSLAFISIFL